ncbi:rab32, member RAS oncoprotein [Apophysomyces sp. BC1015]|nr:rab32, member RAS oncoprotein [Apophysomyces sp. BC1015]
MQDSLHIPRRRGPRESAATSKEANADKSNSNGECSSTNSKSKSDYSIASLVSRKRRRIERQETQNELNDLFQKLNAENIDGMLDGVTEPEPEKKQEDLGAEDNDLLASDSSDEDEDDVTKLADMASRFLDEDQSTRLKEVLTDPKRKLGRRCEYQFFSRRCRLPNPLLIDDGLLGTIDPSVRKCEEYVYKLSQSSTGRSVLLGTGGIYHWFRRGWKCPNYVYQWIFKLVAFEQNIMTAKNAYDTIISLWSNLGGEPVPFQEIISDRRNQNRNITVATFAYVLNGYGALKDELGWGKLSKYFDLQKSGTASETATLMSKDEDEELVQEQRIPLTQFGWVLQLFGHSIRSWPSAYTSEELKYVLRLLFQISLDRVGSLVLKEIQDAIESCLYVMEKKTWEEQVRLAASAICVQFSVLHLQLELLKALKPTYERCIYLRRMIAFVSLEKAMERNDSSTNAETDVPDIVLENTKSGRDILSRLLTILTRRDGIFQSRDVDFEELMQMTHLLDAAIASNENELLREKSEVREYLYKILVVGDLGTGKTSIIRRYVHNIFSSNYKSTIGVDFALKVIQWSPEIIVRLQLWDIAGQERFGNMTRVYYKEALGAFVVYDVTRTQTFEGVTKWKEDIDAKVSLPGAWGGGHIPVVLLANKSDLIAEGHGQPVNVSEMNRFCEDNGFVKWFETSAKDNTNIDEAARDLITAILNIEEEHGGAEGVNDEDDSERVRLDEQRHQGGGGCC